MSLPKLTNLCYRLSSLIGFGCSVYLLCTFKDRSLLRTILLGMWVIIGGLPILRIIAEAGTHSHYKEQYFEKTIEKWKMSFSNKNIGIGIFMLATGLMVVFKIYIPFLING